MPDPTDPRAQDPNEFVDIRNDNEAGSTPGTRRKPVKRKLVVYREGLSEDQAERWLELVHKFEVNCQFLMMRYFNNDHWDEEISRVFGEMNTASEQY